jgi:transposase
VDPAPHRHEVIDIPPIQAEVIEHQLHRLLCPRCSKCSVSINGGAIVTIRARLAGCLRKPMEEALRQARLQPVVYMDETGAPTGNADGGNPDGRRGWLWVLMTPCALCGV